MFEEKPIKQCLYIKRDDCDGTLKDADLYNNINIHSIPYKFDFIGNIKKTNLRNELITKTKACVDKIDFINEVNHEKKLINQLYNGGDFTGMSTKCDDSCKNCMGCDFSD